MRVWVVSEINAGTLNQALGVAEKLTPKPIVKIIRKERGLRRLLFPFRQDISEAEPAVIVSCGRISERFVRIMKESYGGRPFTVHLQYPAPEHDFFDLVFVSRHDWRAEFDVYPHFRPMLGVPHRVTSDQLMDARPAARAKWAPHDERVIALLIGGPNKAFLIDDETLDRLQSTVERLLMHGWMVLATTSRRSPAVVAERLSKISNSLFHFWSFQGENPYFEYLAAADAFLITQDSVTMICEAAASGKPIYTFPLSVKDVNETAKFIHFQNDLLERGIARIFEGKIDGFSYKLEYETERIYRIVMNELRSVDK